MLTPADIANPKRKSGYDHVQLNLPPSRPGRPRPYYAVAYGGTNDKAGTAWKGPARATNLEAAQDYCDHENGQAVQRLPSYAAPSIDMGNTTKHAPKAEKVVVKREVFKGPHDLYDVLIYTSLGELVCRKVGITAQGHARYADVCKTFGLSIKPHARAITFPTKKAAEDAETLKIATVCADKGWRRIGKESFEKVKEVTV